MAVSNSHIFYQDEEKASDGGGTVRGSALHNPPYDWLWYWRGMNIEDDDNAIKIMITMDYIKSHMQIVHMIGCDTGEV